METAAMNTTGDAAAAAEAALALGAKVILIPPCIFQY
jgi:hypothetical protein